MRETDLSELLQKNNFVKNLEAIKRRQEEHLISSCESAETVVEVKELTETLNITKQETEVSNETPEDQGESAEVKPSEDSTGPESFLRRPDNLKGLSPFQRNLSNFAGFGLDFSLQSGSAIARWPSLADKGLPSEDWEHLAFSSSSEPALQEPESAADRYVQWCLD